MEPTAELKQAVRKYREGKAEAFTQLYEESSKYIYTCIYKVMGGNDNVQDAVCDIMQDTYVEISKSIAQLNNENSFLSWAGTIATRKCYAWLKKNKKYVLLHEEDDTFENLADDDNIIPEEVMQDREKQRLVREIIDTQLTEMQKLCIIAFYYNEQKQSEIAQELGIPENTVKTNLSRAKAKIKGGVLDLEKRQGTRLYSVASFLLLLFKEEVSACTVPASVATAVNSSVFAAGKMGIKHLFAKIAEASTKAKVTAGIIGTGVVVAAGSTAYVAMQDRAESWEKEFKNYLLTSNRAVGFDLNDFEGDGIPELIVLNQDGSISVRYSDEYEESTSFEFDAVEEVDYGDFIMKNLYHYGYDVDDKRLLRLGDITISIGEGKEGHNYDYLCLQFQNGKYETWEAVTCGFGTDTYPIQWSYHRTEWGERTDIPQLYASTYMDEAYQRFNEIEYTDITEKDIEERFKEFKENGNREKVWSENSIIEELNVLEAEHSQMEEIFSDVEEVVLSEKEQNDLKTLISMLTFASYFYGEEMEGYDYPVNDIEMDIKLISLLESFSLVDEAYAKYLPPMEVDYEKWIGYCDVADIQDYLKNVFGVENVDLSAYSEEGRVACLLGDLILEDTQIDHVTAMPDGTYKIEGTAVIIEAGVYESNFPYQFIARKNNSSPYGYQVVSIVYQEGEMVDNSFEAEFAADGTLSDILLHPERNSTYYSKEVGYGNLYFALIDIDQDGEDEILLGSAGDIHPNFGPCWITIFNILKYDKNTEKVSDFDGDMVYQPLDALSWHYYDTGILLTMAEVGKGHTNCWNLLTGEFTDTEAVNPDYATLTSGNEIPVVWCEVNRENVEALITGSSVTVAYIPIPYGRYTANRGFTLEFFNDSAVLVSEGNSSKKCVFTIDGAGNIVIDPDGEEIEGTYNAQSDEIKIYELTFRR